MSVRIAVLAIALAVVTTGCVVSGGYHRPAPPPRPAYYPPPAPPPSAGIDIGFFYDALAPYGDWYLDAEFGWVWTPSGVAYGWRPYTEGRWLYTDYGWTWVSDWSWGWAPFHYGRWQFRPRHGWVWVPGREWAPAWVAWRSGDGWVGWAPLPPSVRFRVGVGLDMGNAQLDALIDVHWWSFVDERRLVDSRLRSHVVPEPRNITLVRVTRDVTRYEVTRDRVIVRGVDVDRVSRVTGHPVPRHLLREEASREHAGPARIHSGEVYMYHPKVREAAPDRTPPGHERRAERETSPRPSATRPVPPSAPEPPRTPPPRTPPPARPRPPAQTQPPARTQPQARPVNRGDDQDRARLEDKIRRERAALERAHRKELARPPRGVSREELLRRHEQETKALKERAKRQRAVREARAKEEQQKAKESAEPEKKSRGASKTRGRKKSDRR